MITTLQTAQELETVAHIYIPESISVTRQDYECAAWYAEMNLIPGEYPLIYYPRYQIYAEIPGIITKSNFSSYWGGNMIKGHFDENKGELGKYSLSLHGYDIAGIILGKLKFDTGLWSQATIELAEGYQAYWGDIIGKRHDGSPHYAAILTRTSDNRWL